MKIPRPDPLFLLVLLVAIGIRVAYALKPHVCFGDESCYLWLARNLATGAGYTYYDGQPELHFPPLFPIVLAALNGIVSDWGAVTRVAYVVFGSLMLIPIYFIGRDHYSRRTGLIAAFLAAILPAYTSGVLYAETMGEPLFLFLVFTGIYFICRAEATRLAAWGVAAGATFSLAFLTRPEAMYYLASLCVFLVVAVFLAPAQPHGRSARAVSKLLAAVIVSFLAVASPYVIYLHSHTGAWELSTKDITTYKTTRGLVHHDGAAFQRETWGLNDKGEVVYFAHDFGDSLPKLLLGPYRKQVVDDIRANFTNLESVLLRPWVFGPVLFLLAAIGFIGSTWTASRLLTEVMNLLIIAPVFGILIFFVNERFLYVIFLPLILWAALGVQHLLLWIQGTYLPGSLGWPASRTALETLLVCALTAFLARSGQKYFDKKAEESQEVWDAAAWLKKVTPTTAVTMTTGPEVAFHADRKWLPVPVATHEQVVAYGLKRGATHLCIRGRYLANRPEQKADLFDEANTFDDLELLKKFDDAATKTSFVIYKLKGADPARN